MSQYPKWKRIYWKYQWIWKLALCSLARNLPGKWGQGLRWIVFRGVLKSLGKDVVFQENMRLVCPESISIGSNCNFARDCHISGGGGVSIGSWVGFGPGVKVWSINHRFDDPDRPWLQQGHELKPVVIEDDVWLAANVFVVPGVTIGQGAIISACTVVNKSVPAYSIVTGNPGRVVGWRKKREQLVGSNPTAAGKSNGDSFTPDKVTSIVVAGES